MRMNVSNGRRDGGFTLIEIMVVITIIAALIGAGSLMINIAQKKKMITDTQGRLNAIGAALEMLHNTDQLGRYPPTNIAKLNIPGSFEGAKFAAGMNATNVGSETLYLVFRLPGVNITPQNMDGDDKTANTDNDKATAPVGKMAKPDLFEYVDSWGNPLVYLNSADYKDPSKVDQYVLWNGDQIKITPKKNEKTGEFIRPDSFQLWSLGPDGKPDTDDDLMYGM